MDNRFGKYIKSKREERGITLRVLSDELGIAPSYINDIESGRRNPPKKEYLDKMTEALQLNQKDTATMFDLAAIAREGAPLDLSNYIMTHKNARAALRKARDLGLGNTEWEEIERLIDQITQQKHDKNLTAPGIWLKSILSPEQEVFRIDMNNESPVISTIVTEICFHSVIKGEPPVLTFVTIDKENHCQNFFFECDIGEKLFLTPKDAEKKLEAMELQEPNSEMEL